MRLVIVGLALGLAALGTPGMAAAQGPVATQALGPGEMLLEVNAFGTVSTHADMATLVIPVDTRAATEAEARRQAETMADRIAGAAASAGVPAGDIHRRPIVVGQDAMMAAAVREMERAAEAQQAGSGPRPPVLLPPAAAARPTESAHGEVEIKVRGLDRLPQVRHALEAAGLGAAPSPTYALVDDRAARAEARTQAIAQARANAEGYASTLGMRVARTVRVTERIGTDLIGTMISEGPRMRQLLSGFEGRGQEITTTVALGMDFVLAPR